MGARFKGRLQEDGINDLWIAEQTGGVAYAAHLGGFLAGLVLVWAFRDAGRHRRMAT